MATNVEDHEKDQNTEDEENGEGELEHAYIYNTTNTSQISSYTITFVTQPLRSV